MEPTKIRAWPKVLTDRLEDPRWAEVWAALHANSLALCPSCLDNGGWHKPYCQLMAKIRPVFEGYTSQLPMTIAEQQWAGVPKRLQTRFVYAKDGKG